jgi:hypothetical protein
MVRNTAATRITGRSSGSVMRRNVVHVLAPSTAAARYRSRGMPQLTPADIREIETAFSRIEIYGGRMDARQMAQIGQD